MRKMTRGGFLKALGAASGFSLTGSAGTFARPDLMQTPWLSPGLGTLPVLISAESRQISPENPTGEKGMGARATPNPSDPNLPFSAAAQDLGRGWKVSPFRQAQSR